MASDTPATSEIVADAKISPGEEYEEIREQVRIDVQCSFGKVLCPLLPPSLPPKIWRLTLSPKQFFLSLFRTDTCQLRILQG